MSRPIKFRAWDHQLKEWLGADEWFVRPSGVVGVRVFSEAAGRMLTVMVEAGRLQPVQYIGRKDRNGVEIYDGDVLEYVSPEPEENYPPDRYIVEWIDHGWEATWQHSHKPNYSSDGRLSLQGCEDDMVVIGNRFEHPHLLESAS
ncbi:YopX family protein [Dietzia natronolimnaea]|uniref:YopX family protein n=1 Tax=Dietzia natronolimnaea TaxID=161920 RepID=UPI0015FDD374|nr:YopX family protein [Dietzia natronolimnaea]MBB1037374.1 hypothetical protein [Dietzia natronolimnaea]